MYRIRGLELLFNLEQKNLKSKEDCLVAALHCILINECFHCVGMGDKWSESFPTSSEILPSGWNSNQNVYSLRYIRKDTDARILLKITKMEHLLQVDVVMNEDSVSSMSIPVEKHISDYQGYSSAYKNLESLSDSFRKDVIQKLQNVAKKEKACSSNHSKKQFILVSSKPVAQKPDLQKESIPHGNPRFPKVGGSDLDPFNGEGGMLMDPSSLGIPPRPTLPQLGVGSPGGLLPKGAVPPGARFDPITPPIYPEKPEPEPGLVKAPDTDDGGDDDKTK